jgi:hypothetical protein
MKLLFFLTFNFFLIAADFQYSDGNGNVYLIQKIVKKTAIEYIPVKKEASSSGQYSGGEYKFTLIDDDNLKSLIQYFEDAIEDKATHTDRRIKMTGAIRKIISGKERIECILKNDSRSRIKLEEKLKSLTEE